MNVSSILRRKGTRVETASPDETIGEVSRRLADKGIGSLVVLDHERNLIGVVSERDVVEALAAHGHAASELPLQKVLSGRPPTCRPEDSLEQVLSVMTARRARHLPVFAGEALVGIVSIGDIVKGQLEDLELEVGVLRDYARAKP